MKEVNKKIKMKANPYKAIAEILNFINTCKYQSLEGSANRNCLLLNLEDICRKNNIDMSDIVKYFK